MAHAINTLNNRDISHVNRTSTPCSIKCPPGRSPLSSPMSSESKDCVVCVFIYGSLGAVLQDNNNNINSSLIAGLFIKKLVYLGQDRATHRYLAYEKDHPSMPCVVPMSCDHPLSAVIGLHNRSRSRSGSLLHCPCSSWIQKHWSFDSNTSIVLGMVLSYVVDCVFLDVFGSRMKTRLVNKVKTA